MLTLYNTLTKKKEIFKPLKGNEVSLYTCGPTVYHYSHIGNMRTFLFEDILKRTLTANDFKIKHVMNITDVGHLTSDADIGEDKMEKGARREGKTAQEIAEFYTKAFKKNLKELNIIEPNIWCKATDHIKEQIDWIKKLEQKGYTYKISDGIYFNTKKFPEYGKLSGQKLNELKEGARVEKNPEKKNPTDFALWKFSPKDIKRDMEWDSPWGKGFPGWHLECSVMSQKYLGETIDIHCGGIDLIPIHHTNEIAQAEAVTNKPFVQYWLHGEFVIINPFIGAVIACVHCKHKNLIAEEDLQTEGGFKKICGKCGKELSAEIKMSKSDENFTTLFTVKEHKFDPLAYRYLILNTHYRNKLNFSWKAMQGAQNTLENLYALAGKLGKPKSNCPEFEKRFSEALNDDLNTPKGLAILWELLKSDNPPEAKKASLLKFDKILGLNLHLAKPIKVPDEIKKLAKKREELRKEKNWAEADKIRDEITKQEFKVDDTPAGPVIKK
jgi:cysteinyl-tRNA synthetase